MVLGAQKWPGRGDQPRSRAFLALGTEMLGMVTVVELSSGGVFVAHPQPGLPVGAEVSLRYRSPGEAGINRKGTIERVVTVTESRQRREPAGYYIALYQAPELVQVRRAPDTIPSPPPVVPQDEDEPPPALDRSFFRTIDPPPLKSLPPPPPALPPPAMPPAAATPIPILPGQAIPRPYVPAPVEAYAPAPVVPARPVPDETFVLIVENACVLANLVDTWIRTLGRNTRLVSTGKEALEAMRDVEAQVCLVLVDAPLPDMNTVQLVRQLRTTGQVPVVVTSSGNDRVDASLRASGRCTVVDKPLREYPVCRAVMDLLGDDSPVPEPAVPDRALAPAPAEPADPPAPRRRRRMISLDGS